MAAIAAEAGVALKTVYVAFETKSGVLRALWHLLLRGDEVDVPVGERDWYREVLDEPDPAASSGSTRATRARSRSAPVSCSTSSAARPPPSRTSTTLWERVQREFHDNQRAIVESLAAKQALRGDLDVERATDILWTLNHPDVWQLLVVQRGWTPAEYERWFADAACAQLLRSA